MFNHSRKEAREATIGRLIGFLNEWAEENGHGPNTLFAQVDEKAFRRRAEHVFNLICKYRSIALGQEVQRELPGIKADKAATWQILAGSTPTQHLCSIEDYPGNYAVDYFLGHAKKGSDVYSHPQYLLNFDSESMSLKDLLMKSDIFIKLYPEGTSEKAEPKQVLLRAPLPVATRSFQYVPM